jgi:hypothetical protein
MPIKPTPEQLAMMRALEEEMPTVAPPPNRPINTGLGPTFDTATMLLDQGTRNALQRKANEGKLGLDLELADSVTWGYHEPFTGNMNFSPDFASNAMYGMGATNPLRATAAILAHETRHATQPWLLGLSDLPLPSQLGIGDSYMRNPREIDARLAASRQVSLQPPRMGPPAPSVRELLRIAEQRNGIPGRNDMMRELAHAQLRGEEFEDERRFRR